MFYNNHFGLVPGIAAANKRYGINTGFGYKSSVVEKLGWHPYKIGRSEGIYPG